MRRFEDKVALITGSSRGIGRALALTLAREGASIVVNFNRNADLADEVVREIEALGTRAISVQANMDCLLYTSPQPFRAVRAIRLRTGRRKWRSHRLQKWRRSSNARSFARPARRAALGGTIAVRLPLAPPSSLRRMLSPSCRTRQAPPVSLPQSNRRGARCRHRNGYRIADRYGNRIVLATLARGQMRNCSDDDFGAEGFRK